MALCAAAWLTVAEAYPCTEYSGSGTEPSSNQPLQKHKHQIDLNTGKRLASYKKYGNCNPEWIYIQKKNNLEIKNIDENTAITINNVQDSPHALDVKGNYILLGNLENANDPYYLCNMLEKTYIKIDALEGMGNTAGIYPTTNQDKVLISDGKDAYIIDTCQAYRLPITSLSKS